MCVRACERVCVCARECVRLCVQAHDQSTDLARAYHWSSRGRMLTCAVTSVMAAWPVSPAHHRIFFKGTQTFTHFSRRKGLNMKAKCGRWKKNREELKGGKSRSHCGPCHLLLSVADVAASRCPAYIPFLQMSALMSGPIPWSVRGA